MSLPVTVDFECGYGFAPGELVERLAATGAVGVNLEHFDPASGDIVDVAEQEDWLAAIRAAAISARADVVINARTDSFQRRAGTPSTQLSASIGRGPRLPRSRRRLRLPIGVGHPAVIRTLVDSIPGPVNVGYGPGHLTLAQLSDLGVGRVSFGPVLQLHLYRKFGSALLSTIAADENPWAS